MEKFDSWNISLIDNAHNKREISIISLEHFLNFNIKTYLI